MAPCLSPLCLSVQWRRQTRFHGGHLPISIHKHQFKADDQDAKEHACVEGTGAELCTGAPAQTFLSPQWLCLEWMISSPRKGLSLTCHWGDKKPSSLLSEDWKDENIYMLQPGFLFNSDEANTRLWTSALVQAVHCRVWDTSKVLSWKRVGWLDPWPMWRSLSI